MSGAKEPSSSDPLTYLNGALQLISDTRKNPLISLFLSEVSHEVVPKIKLELGVRKFKELDVILQTPGGSIDPAFNIIKLLRSRAEKVNIIVPCYAKSAGTLICLGADEIVLTELAELGPLDTQLIETHERVGARFGSALNGFKALEQVQQHCVVSLDVACRLLMNISGLSASEVIQLGTEFCGKTSATLYSKLDPKSIGEYARALEIGLHYGVRILTDFMKWPEEKAAKTVRKLVYDYPSHGYIIDYSELLSLSLPVTRLEDELEVHVYNLGNWIPKEFDIIQMIDLSGSLNDSAPLTVEKVLVDKKSKSGDSISVNGKGTVNNSSKEIEGQINTREN